jgi:endopeptidase La
MTEITNITYLKIQYLQYLYKRYTGYIRNFQNHIEKIYSDWIIDTNNRNYALKQLDELIKEIIIHYNNRLTEIYQDASSPDSQSDEDSIDHSPTAPINDISSVNIASYVDMIQQLDMVSKLNWDDCQLGESALSMNPFGGIRQNLIKIGLINGFSTMDDALKMIINNENYSSILAKDEVDTFDHYNQIFVPLMCVIQPITDKDTAFITVEVIPSKCDSLLDNYVRLTLNITHYQKKLVIEGYFDHDYLNLTLRTSQICLKDVYSKKKLIKDRLNRDFVIADINFVKHYLKYTRGCFYLIYDDDQFIEKLLSDYETYKEYCRKPFNIVTKDFVKQSLHAMYTIINVLLMGSEQNISVAGLLFNLTKDKKLSGESVSNIIYKNLSYLCQLKLKKFSSNLKGELEKLKTLTHEDIDIKKKLATMSAMPDAVKSYILEKLKEFESNGDNNYKSQMAVNALMNFPWKPLDAGSELMDVRKDFHKSRDYLKNVASKLESTVFGHDLTKRVLLELVGKWIQNPKSTGQIIGLVGPPGVGKTLIAQSVSSALNVPFVMIPLGGMNDASDLIGHNYTYSGAQYGMIVRQMIKSNNWRCVMLFDEADKASRKHDTNEIYNTLIHITDPNMNQHFQDRFFSSTIDFDISGVLMIFSYNDSSKLDQILLDRIQEIEVHAYSIREKIKIAKDYILKDLCENIGFDRRTFNISDENMRYIIEKYTSEAGVRELKRKLETILLKLNIDRIYLRGPFRKIIRDKTAIVPAIIPAIVSEVKKPGRKRKTAMVRQDSEYSVVDENSTGVKKYAEYEANELENKLDQDVLNKIFKMELDIVIDFTLPLIHRYLEKPVIKIEEIHKANLIGVINGLYVTSMGMGGIMPIQVYPNYIGDCSDGTNLKLKLTGNQKQVMRESVICALTTAVNLLSKSYKNNIMKNYPNGFHIHAPDGGTPKDGPSAGCAFTTAFVSVILNKKINREVAMTGEIELTGKISKIGGLYYKLCGAKKSGVKKVFICEENRDDFDIIKKKNPEMFENQFDVKIVSHIIQVVSDPDVIEGICESDFDPVLYKELLKV